MTHYHEKGLQIKPMTIFYADVMAGRKSAGSTYCLFPGQHGCGSPLCKRGKFFLRRSGSGSKSRMCLPLPDSIGLFTTPSGSFDATFYEITILAEKQLFKVSRGSGCSCW
jgi:hypothetical protein